MKGDVEARCCIFGCCCWGFFAADFNASVPFPAFDVAFVVCSSLLAAVSIASAPPL